MRINFFSSIFFSILLSSLLSCASSPNKQTEQKAQVSLSDEQVENSDKATASEQTESEKQAMPSEQTESEKQAMPAAVNVYKERIADVLLSVASYPKNTQEGKAFAEPYVIHAEKNGNPLPSFKISVYFLGVETQIETDENGNAVYMPAIPQKSMLNSIQFFPSAIEGDIKKDFDLFIECMSHCVRAPYSVHTAKLSKGGVILILDMKDEKNFDDNLPTGSILQAVLRQLGFTGIGNGPDFSQAILSGNKERVYSDAQSFLGKNYTGFLTYGTIKQLSAEKTADGFAVTLSSNIITIDMKTKEIISTVEFSTTGSGKTESQARTQARTIISKEVGGSIYYNL